MPGKTGTSKFVQSKFYVHAFTLAGESHSVRKNCPLKLENLIAFTTAFFLGPLRRHSRVCATSVTLTWPLTVEFVGGRAISLPARPLRNLVGCIGKPCRESESYEARRDQRERGEKKSLMMRAHIYVIGSRGQTAFSVIVPSSGQNTPRLTMSTRCFVFFWGGTRGVNRFWAFERTGKILKKYADGVYLWLGL